MENKNYRSVKMSWTSSNFSGSGSFKLDEEVTVPLPNQRQLTCDQHRKELKYLAVSQNMEKFYTIFKESKNLFYMTNLQVKVRTEQ